MTTFLRTLASLRTTRLRLPGLGIVLAGALLLGGCAGSSNVASRIDTEQVEPLDEVAVLSVRTKKVYQNEIGEASLEDTKDLRKAVSTITKVTERQKRRADPNFEAATEQVRSSLFGTFHAAAPFSLLKEEAVLHSSAYQTLDERQGNHWRSSLFATPPGYESLSPARLKKASFQSLIRRLPAEPDGMLLAKTTYTLVRDEVRQAKGKTWSATIQDGTRTRTTLTEGDTVGVDVKATVRVHVLDRNGNTAMKVVETARSKEGFTFVYGQGWSADQINAATQQATRLAMGNVTNQLRNKLPKNVIAESSSVLDKSGGTELK